MAFEVHSLRPEYSEGAHGQYYEYLKTELKRPNRPKKARKGKAAVPARPRNLALTGSYGAGKSSILSKVVEDFNKRVVSVSLSTLGSEEVNGDATAANKDPLETPAITNSIQKEIVKQLLYREKPRRVPGSRYKRIERFRHLRAAGLASIIACALTAVVLITGWMSRVEAYFDQAFRPVLLSYGGLFALILLSTYAAQAFFHNRLRVEKVGSGPASVSLTDKTESFFDKYLDELVYFFEVNSYNIVIFEDLDRFNDPYIFETLRELNTLLNSSKQISPNVITFIYAIKDSIFEQLGQLSINGKALPEADIQRLAVTNRTKFFDLVIPVVPFISHRNARDLLSAELKSSGFEIDKTLIHLTSRYLVDMRLIKNVHNEFGVFADKILGASGVKGLDRHRLFAMVVYKNLNMADFEKIKDGSSVLDKVHAAYRELVNHQVAATDLRIRIAQANLRHRNSVSWRSRQLGDRLEEYVRRLLRQSASKIDTANFALSTPVTVATFRTSEFWSEWLRQPEIKLEVTFARLVYNPAYYSDQTMSMTLKVTLDDLRVAFNEPFDQPTWQAADAAALRAEIAKDTAEREFLKHATLKEVINRTDLELPTEAGESSLVTVAQRHVGTGLALELLQAGHIDRNFSLYVSLYYDETVTAVARNFLLHVVETNTMDEHAQIGTGDEIEAMLEEAGPTFFQQRSAYNIQTVDHLLEWDDERLDATLRRLARTGTEEERFLQAYFSSGRRLDALVRRLAPVATWLPLRVITDGSIEDAERSRLFDIALCSLSDDDTYDTDVEMRHFIEENFASLPRLLGKRPGASAEIISCLMEAAEVRLPALEPLAEDLLPLVVEKSLYRLTRENLVVALSGERNLALDQIRSISQAVYDYAISDLKLYLNIIDYDDGEQSIQDPAAFTDVMNDIADRDAADVERVIGRAVDVIVADVRQLSHLLWPAIARADRLQATFGNVSAYVEKIGGIDASLGTCLSRASSIEDLSEVEQISRLGLAVALIGCPHLTVSKRAELAASLDLEEWVTVSELDASKITEELAGLLRSHNLVSDSVETFTALSRSGWPAQRGYMMASSRFVEYFKGHKFSATTFRSLTQDAQTPEEVKRAILSDLDAFAESVSRESLVSLAQFALADQIVIQAEVLLRFAQANVASDTLVRLIDLQVAAIDIDDLLATLAEMPKTYQKLTATGSHTNIPNTAENIHLADRLIAEGRVSSRDARPSGPTLRVNLRRRI